MDRRRLDSRLREQSFQDGKPQRGGQPIDRQHRSTPRRSGYLRSLLRWVRRYPFASLVIVWASLVVLGVVAAISLTILEAQNQVAERLPFSPEATLVAPEIEITPILQPVMLAAAIAFCCASACLVWFRTMPQPSRSHSSRVKAARTVGDRLHQNGRTAQVPQEISFRVQRRSTDSPIAARSTQSTPQPSHLPMAQLPETQLTETQLTATQCTDTQAIATQSATQSTTQPATQSTSPQTRNQVASASTSVSIVPSHQSHPLDWDEPSLADHLDLRRRRPCSDWLK